MIKKWTIRFFNPLAILISLVALIMTAGWFNREVLQPGITVQTHGFGAYYTASRLVVDGRISADIYDPEYFRPLVAQESQGRAEDIYNANPPTTALMLWPLASLTMDEARSIWSWLNIGFLVGGIVILLWGFGVPLRKRANWPLCLATITFGLLFQPTIHNFIFGQAYLLIFLLLSIATAVFFKNHPSGGLALALSLLLKTAGWPLLILVFWLRRGRYIVWVIGSAALIMLTTLLIFPLDMWTTYIRLLREVGRSPLICVPAYQTTRSWLCHLFDPDVFWQEAGTVSIPALATIAYFILGVGFLLIILKVARKRPNQAFIAAICWSVLFLPLGETHHHTVILIPFIYMIIRGYDLNRLIQLPVILAAILYLIKFQVNAPDIQSGFQSLLAYPYLAGAWLLFLAILWDHKTNKKDGLQHSNPAG